MDLTRAEYLDLLKRVTHIEKKLSITKQQKRSTSESSYDLSKYGGIRNKPK